MRLHKFAVAGTAAVAVFFSAGQGGFAASPAGLPLTTLQTGADDSTATATYIVQMLDQPAVVYEGRISGHPATKPAKGKKIDPDATHVMKYVGYLKGKHDAALAKAGGGKKLYDYGFAFNGFAAVLTQAQAEKLRTMKNVVAVAPDTTDFVNTSTTPTFLELTGTTGFWQTTGAVGENIVIGVLDTGFWPENPAYSDRTGTNPNGKPGKLDYKNIPGWKGKCKPGEDFNASMCNKKVIAAQAYSEGALASGEIPDFEFLSPRDFDGHGSHTSSTAGGNFGVQPTGDTAAFPPISGIAPRARLAIYKVCWELPDQSNARCTSSDRVAAIDQAVSDGVDVLNHSIGATQTNFLDPVQIAFFNAAAAGVFVAASAGNSGPTASTVESPGPWLTTVAASTHDRDGQGSVTIGNVVYNGASLAPVVTTGTLADGENSGLSGTDMTSARLCFSDNDNIPANGVTPVLDPALVTGRIVLCDRGTNALVDKSFAVKQAGGIGMVLTNVDGGATTLNALLHSVPTVHVAFTVADYAALHAAADAAQTATIAMATIVTGVPAPFIASFSSRGPSNAASGDILKPDISAPGVDVLAAVSPASGGRDFDILSGTSMSSPHVAGAGALLKDLHPDWSPMMIKSALMTTGYDLLSGSSPFAQGAGHIDLTRAGDPGLVYDSGPANWISFICGTGQLTGSLCATFGTIDPSDLNQASIAIGDLAGAQTITRTVKNVGSASETYTAAASGLSGLTVDVSPSMFTIAPGGSQTYTVAFTRTTATLNAYTTGFLTWNGSGGHDVRSPVAIRPVAIAAPAEVTFNTATGPVSWQVKTGFAGTLGTAVRGLVAATTTPYTVAQDPDQNWIGCGDTQGAVTVPVTVPVGATIARIGIYEDAITPSGTDLDLFICLGTSLVGVSADGDSNEEVTFTFVSPRATPLALTAYVHGFATNGPSATGTLFDWSVGSTSVGNTTLAITPVGPTTIGGSKTIEATFAGLAAGTRYLGTVRYDDGAVVLAQTILRVNTP